MSASRHDPKALVTADDISGAVVEATDPVARAKLKKAPNAFRTISEVADDLHIPQHVLRFWETKFPQVKPLKRGGGRRYYRPDDIVLLRRISDLLYIQGYTIKGVQRLLREGGGALSDDIPPPTAEEREPRVAAEAESQLAIPGLAAPHTAAIRPAGQRPMAVDDGVSIPAIAPPRPDGDEARALRQLLCDVLVELEAMRASLGVAA
jgi:DNA-binding transcriptional MerR regulator